MCLRTCNRAMLLMSDLCDDCIDDAYHWDTFVDRNLAAINAAPASDREYREFVETETFSADDWREEQKREAATLS